MANRILRDWTFSEKINELSEQSEIFFTRLIMKADDFGRFYGSSKLLKAQLYPLKDYSLKQIELWRDECVRNGIIKLYISDDKEYLEIKEFNQRLRLMKSKFPEPKDDCGQMTVNCLTSDGSKRSRNEVETETEVETKNTLSSSSNIDFVGLLDFINKTFGKKYRAINDNTKKKYNKLLKTIPKEDIIRAIVNCKNSDFHKESKFRFCTPSYFSRFEIVEKWGTQSVKTETNYNPRG